MYHAIVKRIANKNFERVNERDFASLLKVVFPTFIIVSAARTH
jgi:hypothetical protein